MPFVRQNVFAASIRRPGGPMSILTRKPGTDKMADFCPSWSGGKNWPPAAFNPKTRMLYIPPNENLCATMIGGRSSYVKGRSYAWPTTNRMYIAPGADHIGEVQAWNVDTGKRVWTHTSQSRRTGGRS